MASSIVTKFPFATEEQFQAHAFQWFWNSYPDERQMMHHNMNNAHNRIKGARNKAVGVVAGVADLEWILYEGKTLWIELKLPGKTQLPEQLEFEKKVRERGHIYKLIYSFEEFQSLVWQVIGKN